MRWRVQHLLDYALFLDRIASISAAEYIAVIEDDLIPGVVVLPIAILIDLSWSFQLNFSTYWFNFFLCSTAFRSPPAGFDRQARGCSKGTLELHHTVQLSILCPRPAAFRTCEARPRICIRRGGCAGVSVWI
jgi:hypothetical protein